MEEKDTDAPPKYEDCIEGGDKAIDLTQLDADKVLTAFGRYGKYQMMAYVVTNVTWLIFAAEMMVMAFITAEPPYSCQINENPETVLARSILFQLQRWLFQFFPPSYNNDTCNVYDLRNVSYACGQNGTEFVFNTTNFGHNLVSEVGCRVSAFSKVTFVSV